MFCFLSCRPLRKTRGWSASADHDERKIPCAVATGKPVAMGGASGTGWRPIVNDSSRKRVTHGDRPRPGEKGPDADSKRIATGRAPGKGGILDALRRSPLVGEDAIPPRPFDGGRKVDL